MNGSKAIAVKWLAEPIESKLPKQY